MAQAFSINVRTDVCDNALVAADKALREFFDEHPDILFLGATLDEEICCHEWEYILSANYSIKIEGIDENRIINVEWRDWGNSCYSMGTTFDGHCNITPSCIYQNDKWYLLDESAF